MWPPNDLEGLCFGAKKPQLNRENHATHLVRQLVLDSHDPRRKRCSHTVQQELEDRRAEKSEN